MWVQVLAESVDKLGPVSVMRSAAELRAGAIAQAGESNASQLGAVSREGEARVAGWVALVTWMRTWSCPGVPAFVQSGAAVALQGIHGVDPPAGLSTEVVTRTTEATSPTVTTSDLDWHLPLGLAREAPVERPAAVTHVW